MNQFESALAKIKAINGVSYGIISTADIEAVAANVGIEKSMLTDLYSFLSENGIEVYSEERAASILATVRKKDDQSQKSRSEKFESADDGLETLLASDMDEQSRQAWIKLIEKRENLNAVFVLKRQGHTASEIAVKLNIPTEEVFRREYCICQRLRMVRGGHSHKRVKQIKDFYV